MPWIEYDMKSMKYAHGYHYDFNLEMDNMCFDGLGISWFMALWVEHGIMCTMYSE